jgi:SAM-dependent methyltransferase
LQDKAFSTIIWQKCLATQELLCIYLGLKLGLYEALAQAPADADALASRLNLDARYVGEWLAQQATAGILTFDGSAYSLPKDHATVLASHDSDVSRVAGIMPLGGVARALPDLVAAFRNGNGVPDSVFGEDWQCGHAGANAYFFENALAGILRDVLPDLYLRLTDEGGTVVDLGCGTGGAALALARRFPLADILGVDLNPAGLRTLRQRAQDDGLDGRIRTATSIPPDTSAKLVILIDTLHEAGRPDDLLAEARARLAPGGSIVVIDARVGETERFPGDEIERFQATTSVLHCLPAARALDSSGPTGTMLRQPILARLAARAGLEVTLATDLPDRFHRLYRLDPADCARDPLEAYSPTG